MKKIVALMLGLVAGTASFAHSSTTRPSAAETRLVMTADHKIKFYAQAFQTNGEVVIWDANGQVVYSSRVNLQNGFKQQFDLSSLGIGTYHITLKTNKEIVTKTFVLQARPDQSFVMQES